jgi:predicted Zn-dependent protease
MHMRRWHGLFFFLIPACTSFEGQEKTASVGGQFNEAPPSTGPRVARSALPTADESVSLRVDYVGRKVVSANPQIGMRPIFATISSEQPELFHVDQRIVYVTDGLVKKLTSEADLAAALSYELGRMVAEREARVKQELRQAPPRPPIQVPVGNAGQFPGSDMVATAELARYDQQVQAQSKPPVRPNPDSLARAYLEKAGFQRVDLDRVQPALQAAARNGAIERQLKGFAPSGNWAP